MKSKRDDRIGQRRMNTKGLYMEIIDYKDAKDITVRFDDGEIREHTNYQHFLSGNISHPLHKKTIKTFRVGEKRKNIQGYEMEIIKYRDNEDLDVIFEDGTVLRHITYFNFISGLIGHPNKPMVKEQPKKIRLKNKFMDNDERIW